MDTKKLQKLIKTMPKPLNTIPVVVETTGAGVGGEAGPEFAEEAAPEETSAEPTSKPDEEA